MTLESGFVIREPIPLWWLGIFGLKSLLKRPILELPVLVVAALPWADKSSTCFEATGGLPTGPFSEGVDLKSALVFGDFPLALVLLS